MARTYQELVGIARLENFDPRAGWASKNAGSPLRIPVGYTDDDAPVHIELSRFHSLDDHCMAVGDTSDLVETIAYTLRLYRNNQDLAVLAVKGNSDRDTFDGLEGHCSGVVRPDLSPGARTAWRLGQVLSGEIDRRREALEQAEVTNISDYQKLNPDHRFPELFVVFDDPAWLLDGDDITEVWQDLQQHGHLLAIRFIVAIPYPEWERLDPKHFQGITPRFTVGLTGHQTANVFSTEVPDETPPKGQAYLLNDNNQPIRFHTVSAREHYKLH
ncbi:hypothetical protein [Mycobacteroides abscessus]